MRRKIKRILIAIILILVILFAGWHAYIGHLEHAGSIAAPSSGQWQHSSENKDYPDVNQYPHLWILVSKRHQRVYLINRGKVLYTMYASTGTGKSDHTLSGWYHIQAERGNSFYNSKSGEGANYWVSWKNHGEYLFHSVPVDRHGNYVISEANKLGKTAASHGCVRLSIPDARWLFQNIKQGTRVIITQ